MHNSQNKMLTMLIDLESYNPKNSKKIKSREETLINQKHCMMLETRSLMYSKMESFPFKDRFRKEKSSDEIKLDLKIPKLDEIPERIQGSKEDVKRIIKDFADNLDSKDYTANVGGTNYNLKNAQKILPKILVKIKQKKLYKELMQQSIDVLFRTPGVDKEIILKMF